MTNTDRTALKKRRLRRYFGVVGKRLRENPHGQGQMPVSSRLATWVGIISAMIGGFLGLDTYKTDVAKQVDQSVEKTFDLVHRFNAPEMDGARTRVLSYVYARRYCDARYFSRDLTDEDYADVIDFFDLVDACVDAKLCDRATVERFFTPYANYQWPILETVVERMRGAEQSLRADSAFGSGMKRLATGPLEAPPCDGNF
ncbi:MAG: hypothetical protein AAFW83_01355 [Pseudomonadota bacterium]